jgi:replicative DNA helicase
VSTAERHLIGCIVLDDESIDIARRMLEPTDFAVPANRIVFEAACELADMGWNVDLGTLSARVADQPHLRQLGGARYLAMCAEPVVSAVAVETYAEIVLQDSIQRQLSKMPKPDGDAHSSIAASKEHIAQLEERLRQESRSETMAEVVHTLRERLPKVWSGELAPAYVLTPWDDVNEMLGGGLYSGHMTVIAARTSVGKTAAAEQIVQWLAGEGVPCVYYSQEMTKLHHAIRMARRAGMGVSAKQVWGKGLADYKQQDVWQHLEKLERLPIRWPDRLKNPRVDRLIGLLDAEMRVEPRPRLVVIDYFQKIKAAHKHKRPDQALAEVSTELHDWCARQDVPLLTLAQLNRLVDRDNRKGEPRRPVLSDIRECGRLEEDAAAVLLLHRPEMQDGVVKDRENADIVHGKARWGKTGVVPVTWLGRYMQFVKQL